MNVSGYNNTNSVNFVFVSVVLSFVVLSITQVLSYCYSTVWCGYSGVNLFVGSWLLFDNVFLILGLLSLILLYFVWISLFNYNSFVVLFFVMVSVISSIICFSSLNVLSFLIFYELSIVSLLVLLINQSPYPERYIASWYFGGYILVSGLPLLLIFFFMAFNEGVLVLLSWSLEDSFLVFLVVVLFVTKVPLFPFHVWLPIVHAEASWVVSICLSGYIMKLGFVGVIRFCLVNYLSSMFVVAYFLVLISVLFFVCALLELDGKRWLALLSLAHMNLPFVVLCIGNSNISLSFVFLYLLGHGVSAGVIFGLLWYIYELTGSRNWVVLKQSVSTSISFRLLCAVSLLGAASFPLSMQFCSEIVIVYNLFNVGYLIGVITGVCLFLGGLVPLFIYVTITIRYNNIGLTNLMFGNIFYFFVFVNSLVIFFICFILF